MVNPLCHCLRVLFCTRYRIPFRGLSRSWGILFWITLRGLSVSRVPPGLVVPTQPLLVPVCRYFKFYIYILLLWHIWVLFIYGAISGGVLWHSLLGSSFTIPRICWNGFVVFCLWPNKISCLLLEIFFAFPLRWLCCLPLHCPLPPVWVVVGGLSLLGPSS